MERTLKRQIEIFYPFMHKRWIMWKIYCFLMNFSVFNECLQCQLSDTLIPKITGYGVLSVSLQKTFDKWRSKNYCSKDVNRHGFTRKDHETIWFLAEKIKKTTARRIHINIRKKWLRKSKIENGIYQIPCSRPACSCLWQGGEGEYCRPLKQGDRSPSHSSQLECIR